MTEELVKKVAKYSFIIITAKYLLDLLSDEKFNFFDGRKLKKAIKFYLKNEKDRSDKSPVIVNLSDPAEVITQTVKEEFDKMKKVKVEFQQDNQERPTIRIPSIKKIIGIGFNFLFKRKKNESIEDQGKKDKLIQELERKRVNEDENKNPISLSDIIEEYEKYESQNTMD